MRERPELNKKLDAATFRSFYYLKQELANFCKENGLPTSGSKIELTDPGKNLHDAIVCWNYKKGLPGHHRYEQSDLCALDLQILQNS